MRATFLAGGDGDRRAASSRGVRSIDLAPTAAFLLDVPAPQHSQGVVRRDLLDDGAALQAAVDHRAERLPRPARPDDDADRRAERARRRRRRSSRRCSTRRRPRCPGGRCCWRPATTSAPRRRTRPCSRTGRRSTSRTRGGWTPRAYGNHEFDFGIERLLAHQERADFPFLSANIVEEATGAAPDWLRAVGGVPRQRRARRRDRRHRPDDAGAGARRRDRGPALPRRGRADRAGVRAAAQPRRPGAGRRHPRGRRARRQRRRRPARSAVGGPDHRRSPRRCSDTTVDLVIAGHTHRDRQHRRRPTSRSSRASTPAAATRSRS